MQSHYGRLWIWHSVRRSYVCSDRGLYSGIAGDWMVVETIFADKAAQLKAQGYTQYYDRDRQNSTIKCSRCNKTLASRGFPVAVNISIMQSAFSAVLGYVWMTKTNIIIRRYHFNG
jgi:hypothetical protein